MAHCDRAIRWARYRLPLRPQPHAPVALVARQYQADASEGMSTSIIAAMMNAITLIMILAPIIDTRLYYT